MTMKPILALLLLLAASLGAQTTPPLTSSVLPPDHPNFDAWRDRRFGMFIHWGPVSIKGTEIGWSRAGERRDRKETVTKGIPAAEYDNLYKQFNPVKFNADEWAAVAKAAGMKYIVLIAKHHDGFCMFDSALTDYKITNTPFKRDVTAELAKACKKAGLSFGLYYSPPDWHHPDYCTENHARYIKYLHGQVREILTKYGPIDCVWFDRTGGVNDAKTWDNPALFKMVRELQPQTVITTRCGGGPHGGKWGDFDTPEQRVGGFQIDRPWETCMTICQQWAWKPNDKMKSLQQCLDTLIRTSGGDGNLLFNVGPTPEGLIEQRQVDRLKEMGAWLKLNGETIYGTRGGPWKPAPQFVSTRKQDKIYLHLLKKVSGPVSLTALPVAIKSAKLLHGPAIKTETKDGLLSFEIPDKSWEAIDTIVEITIDGNSMDITPLNPQKP